MPDPTPTAPDVVDHRREALATYLLDEVEIYCSTRDSALRRADEILAACDAHGAAAIERLRATLQEARQILLVPAAEYVPAIGNAIGVINKALGGVHGR